jgi:predicted Fe-Mo cluster-binding NifX family protein
MKIAVSTKGNMSTSTVVPFSDHYGGFVIYDSDKLQFTYLEIPTEQTPSQINAIHFSKMMVEAGIEVLVVGGITLQAAKMLGCCGIKIYECIGTTVWEAIQGLKLNMLLSIDTDSGLPATCSMVGD